MSTMPALVAAHADATPRLAPHNAFYEQFTARNRGLVDDADQQRLRRASILVAGCGSIGGAVVEPLVRLGAEHLVLAEPDAYEVHNLNRQHARLADVGRNKAQVLAERAREINPYVDVRVDERGITDENVVGHVEDARLIFDGVDVTTRPALACKYALHVQAQRQGVPVVCGYDIAGAQLVLVYDYRIRSLPVLGDRLAGQSPADLEPMRFLARVVPLRALPVEIFPVLRAQLSGDGTAIPQLVYSAHLYGVLACRIGVDLLACRPVRRCITVDVHMLTRPAGQRWRTRWAWLAEVMRMSRVALSYRR